MIRAGLAAMSLAWPIPALACAPDYPWQAVTAEFAAALRPDPAPVRISETFALDIALCPGSHAAPALRRVDAEMPAHRHGMNYRPSLTATGPDRWRAEGLLFHMPGLWEIRLDLDGAPPLRVRVTIK